MKLVLAALGCVGALNSVCFGQQVSNFAELEGILGDQIVIEDFEGISLHSGGFFDLPNPLNAEVASNLPFPFNLEIGVTYISPTMLRFFGGFSNGDDDIFLHSHDGFEIQFDVAQVAFGHYFHGSGSDIAFTVDVYDRDSELIESYASPSSSFFVGYQAPTRGISRVVISHPVIDLMVVNNVAFGLDFIACPADVNGDLSQDFFDVSAFLAFFSAEDNRADLNDDGQFNFFDVSAFLNAFTVACP